jgi:hypothetical protein
MGSPISHTASKERNECVINWEVLGTPIKVETRRYVQHLKELGITNVTHHQLDWRFWNSAPWVMTNLVKATKPG